jgi:hypothetical protein
MLQADFPPDIGPLNEDEIRLIDAALPALALGDNTVLEATLQAILHRHCSAEQWQYYESLPTEQQATALARVRDQIPMIGP